VKLVKRGIVVVGLLIVVLVGWVYLAPESAVRAVYGLERHRSGLVRKEIGLPNGLRFVYLEGGPSDGRAEPLMLLHGFGGDKDNFTRAARSLTPRYRVIIPDLTGFGESSHPAGADYAPPAQVERLRELAKALGIGKLHLGGSSMGGDLAMTWAVNHPGEVESLWLLDPAGVWSVPPKELDAYRRKTGRELLIVRSGKELGDTLAFAMSDAPFIPRPMLDVIARPRIANAVLEEGILRQIRADPMEARVRGLATPALIVWGDHDRVLDPRSAEVLHKLLPASRVVIMKGLGHLPMFEQPQRSADVYLAFRKELAARKPPAGFGAEPPF
jgi:pimeloyl-ACP methyl ester carboxylesterase